MQKTAEKTSTNPSLQVKYSCDLYAGDVVCPYTLMDTQLQAAILNHINTVISVPWSKESLSLVQLD